MSRFYNRRNRKIDVFVDYGEDKMLEVHSNSWRHKF